MTGNELLRKLRKVAKQRGLEYRFVTERGKGSQLLHFLWVFITFHGNEFHNKDLLCRCGGCVILFFAYSETPAVPAGCRAKRAGHLPVACKDGGEHVSALRRATLRTYSGGCTAVLAASKSLEEAILNATRAC